MLDQQMYKHRYVEERLKEMAQHFKVILVTGSRQVGKTTLLQHVFPRCPVITFDQYSDPHQVRTQGDSFLAHLPTPVILDEIQFVPELLASIKKRVDQSDKRGQYFLTGSQNLSMLTAAAESMTGRVGILNLEGMSLHEAVGIQGNKRAWLPAYLENPEIISVNANTRLDHCSFASAILRGGLPDVLLAQNPNMITPHFESYVRTYLERDVRVASNLRHMDQFLEFTKLCAGLTGREINYTQLGREIGAVGAKAKDWQAILRQTYQWRLHEPYFRNTTKRVSKKSKGYFVDTGVACHLLDIHSELALQKDHHVGELFETFVVNNLHQQAAALPHKASFYHWRSNSGAEVDIVIKYNGVLYPIEVKLNSNVTTKATTGIRAFKNTHPTEEFAHGIVLYTGTRTYRIDEHATAVPWDAAMLH